MLIHQGGAKGAWRNSVSASALILGLFTVPSSTLAATAAAEAAATADRDQGPTIGELVVTAQKREENLQDVPVAITAFTAAVRDKAGIVSAQEQLNFTPGVTYYPGVDRITVRGVGRVTTQIGTDGGVAVYQDGFYVGTALGLNASSLGIDRSEILRGPQGTLYGRNSIGGAVNVISRMPDREFTGDVRASLNSYSGTTLEARVSGPISEHIRLSAQFTEFQQDKGYYHDVLPPPHAGSAPGTPNGEGPLLNTATVQPITDENIRGVGQEGAGTGHGWTGNFQVAFDIGDNFEGWLRYVAVESHTRPRDTVGISDWSLLPLIVPNVFTGFQPDQNPGITDHRAFFANRSTRNDLHDDNQVIGHLTWHAGAFDVKYIGGFWQYTNNNFIDGDATGDPNFRTPGLFGGTVIARNDIAYRTNDIQKSWSHEIDITSTNDSPFQWLVGAYYYDEKHHQDFDVPDFNEPHFDQLTDYLFSPANPFTAAFTTALGPTPTGPVHNPQDLLYFYQADLHTKSEAVFAQVDYRPNDQWHFIAGLRYSHDEKTGYEKQYSITQIVLADQAKITAPLVFVPVGTPGCTPLGPGVCLDTANSGLNAMTQLFSGGALSWPTYPADSPFAGQFVMDYVFEGCSGAGTPLGVAQGITSVDPTVAPCPGQRSLKNSWSAPTGTLGVEFTPTSDTNLYARYTRGYKSGGYNLGTLAQGAVVDAEHIDAFEGGWKQDFGHRLQINAALYYYLYHGLQSQNGHVAQVDPPIIINQLVNLDKARSYGLELETRWAPVENLLVMFNYAYINNRITKACCFADSSDPGALQPGAKPVAGLLGAQDLAGNRLPDSPRHKIAANISYTFKFEPGELTLSAIEDWHSSFYNSLFNNPHWFVKGGAETNARISWTAASKKYEIIGSVTNLFNKEIPTAVTTLPPNQNFYQLLSLQPPRVFTAELRYHF